MLLALWPGAHCDSSLARAVTDSRGYVSGDRACHAMGVSASARRIVRRVDLGRIVALSNTRSDPVSLPLVPSRRSGT